METPKIKSVPEVVSEMTKHTMWRDNDQKMLEDRLTETITQDRASLHTSLVAAVEGMKRDLRQIEEECHKNGVAVGKRKRAVSVAFGNNQACDSFLTIINSIFKE